MSSSHSRKSSKNLCRQSRSPGIALVSVLWLLLLLSGLAATVSYIARVNALLARHALDLARAQAAADAGIVNTIARLADEQPSRRPQLNVAESWEFDSLPVTVLVRNEAGRIDVNAANDELLGAFLQVQGVSANRTSDLLQQLHAWRGSDTAATATGATARLRYLETLEELREVPGWRDQNLDCWSASLTVYSGRPDIATTDATPGVIAALEWLRTHTTGMAKSTAVVNVTPSTTVFATPSTTRSLLGEVVRIRATATANEVSTTSEWVGRVTGDAAYPTLTMRWDHDAQATAAPVCGKSP